MHATLLITNFGTPLLLLPCPRQAGTTVDLLPPSTVDFLPELIRLVLPGDRFPAATADIPGFPPEFVSHLARLPGLWCVAVDSTGAPVWEWAATQKGASPTQVTALLPRPGELKTVSDINHQGYLAAVQDGIYAAAQSHSWPPGGSQDGVGQPPNLATMAALGTLSATPPALIPPAGAFWGGVAPVNDGQRNEHALAGRLFAAIEMLKVLTVAGQPIGKHLFAVQQKAGINLAWSSAQVDLGGASPPLCGWDAATRTVYLPAALDPRLDASYLGVGLYAANASLSGQSAIVKFVRELLRSTGSLQITFGDFADGVGAEAARAWVLLGELCRACADLAGSSEPISVLSALPWGRVFSLLPPAGQSGDAYAKSLGVALRDARQILTPTLSPALHSFWEAGLQIRATWFDAKSRATLPTPKPSQSSPAVLAAPRTTVCSQTKVAFPPGAPPLILYTAPSYSRLRGEAVVHFRRGAGQGTMILEREDGGKVYLTEIPPQHLGTLASSKSATVLWGNEDEDVSEPQTVPVRSEVE